MAIPTQFSVARVAKCPIANPLLPQDAPTLLDAENVSLVGSASTIGALSVGEIDTPVEFTPESISIVDSAVIIGAESASDIDAPTELTAESAAEIDDASIIGAESAATVDTPDELTAKAAQDVDSASVIGAESKQDIDAPSPATAESAASIATPSALTPIAGTLTSPPFPLNHARILYDNKLIGADASSDIAISTGSPSYITNPNTAQAFYGNGTGYLRVDIEFDAFPDTVCIGAHNLGSAGYTVTPYYRETSGGTLTQFASGVTPTSNAPIMWHRSDRPTVRVISLYFTPVGASNDFRIGYISAGVALQMQRPFFNGHQPFVDGDVTEYYSNRTESGERIGRIIRRKGFQTSFEWQNIDDGWYRQYMPEFKSYAKVAPFFVAWNLLEYPEDVAFGETTGDIKAPMQNGFGTKRSGLSFDLAGL